MKPYYCAANLADGRKYNGILKTHKDSMRGPGPCTSAQVRAYLTLVNGDVVKRQQSQQRVLQRLTAAVWQALAHHFTVHISTFRALPQSITFNIVYAVRMAQHTIFVYYSIKVRI